MRIYHTANVNWLANPHLGDLAQSFHGSFV